MDFIEGLPSTQGRNMILVVVYQLSKYGHFITIKHPYSAAKVADIFLREVFRLHGMPATIVSNRGLIFISHLWEYFSSSMSLNFVVALPIIPSQMAKPRS